MGRRTRSDDLDERPSRPRTRAGRLRDEPNEEPDEAQAPATLDLAESLLALCQRWGVEPWAAARDERGIWAFATVLAHWIERRTQADTPEPDLDLQIIRLTTNLFVILGAVIRPSESRPPRAEEQALLAVNAARLRLLSRHGLLPSFRGSGRAMRRLTRVRGWERLSPAQQSLAEALLGLYLETLASLQAEPAPEAILAASEAWLAVLSLQALPPAFDERLLRATAWYLENLSHAGRD